VTKRDMFHVNDPRSTSFNSFLAPTFKLPRQIQEGLAECTCQVLLGGIRNPPVSSIASSVGKMIDRENGFN